MPLAQPKKRKKKKKLIAEKLSGENIKMSYREKTFPNLLYYLIPHDLLPFRKIVSKLTKKQTKEWCQGQDSKILFCVYL